MDLWNKITGTVLLEMTCADPERMLNHLSANNIALWDVKRSAQLLVAFRIKRRDWKALQMIGEKFGASIRPIGLQGLFFELKTWAKRPVILVWLFFLSILTLILPERILFVDVVGNTDVPTRMILEEAAKQGLRFGADRRALRSEAIKNELLGSMDSLEWVGVNTDGCRAVIRVRERGMEPQQEPFGYSSLVASVDGIIERIVMSRGTLLCKVGQAVQEGDVLVSGYSDLGICTRATDAQAEIYALTNREMHGIVPCTMQKKDAQRKEEVRIHLIFGKKRINLYTDSGILPPSCGKMIDTYPLRLPGGDQIPVKLVIERIVWYDISNTIREEADTQELLLGQTQRCLMAQIVAGQILTWQTELEYNSDFASLQGRFQCREMIARRKISLFLEGDTQDDSQNSQRGAG